VVSARHPLVWISANEDIKPMARDLEGAQRGSMWIYTVMYW